MKYKALTAAALSLCLLTGCGGGDADSAEDALTPYIGTWSRVMLEGSETLTLCEDMTYTLESVSAGDTPVKTTIHDTWSVEGNTITIVCEEQHSTTKYRVAFSGNIMTWDNDAESIAYTKK